MNKFIEEKNNIEWVLPHSHLLHLTKSTDEDKNHEPKNLAKWSEQALNIILKRDVAEEGFLPLSLQIKLVIAKELLPMQTRVRVIKSLRDQITNKWNSLKDVLTTSKLSTKNGPFPILTGIGKYIIDGHHRWAQYMITNPTAAVTILDIPFYRDRARISQQQEFLFKFDETLQGLLIDMGEMTVITEEEYAKKEEAKNSNIISLRETEEYINQHITRECIEILYEYKKINKDSKQEALEYFLNNLNYFITFVN